MLTILHTFDSPDRDRLLAEIRRGIDTLQEVAGFKYASLNQQVNTNDVLLVTKWADLKAYEAWVGTVGENNAFKQATPQIFEVIQEQY